MESAWWFCDGGFLRSGSFHRAGKKRSTNIIRTKAHPLNGPDGAAQPNGQPGASGEGREGKRKVVWPGDKTNHHDWGVDEAKPGGRGFPGGPPEAAPRPISLFGNRQRTNRPPVNDLRIPVLLDASEWPVALEGKNLWGIGGKNVWPGGQRIMAHQLRGIFRGGRLVCAGRPENRPDGKLRCSGWG